MVIPHINIKRLTSVFATLVTKLQPRIKIKSHNKKKKKKKMKSTKTIINTYPRSDLNPGCPDWKAGVLTTTLTVLAGRRNYNIHIRELYLQYLRRTVFANYRFVNKRCLSI